MPLKSVLRSLISSVLIITTHQKTYEVLNQELVNTKSYISTTLSEQDLVAGHLEKCEQLLADININCRKLSTMYWIPKLHKKPYKARFIANSSSCTINQNQGTCSTLL